MARAGRPSPGEVTLFGREPREDAKPALPKPPRAPLEDRDGPAISGNFAQVALNRPVDCEFTYRIGDSLLSSVRPGVRVAVPFGTSREVGVVTSVTNESNLNPKRLREIAKVLDPEPMVSDQLQSLTRWIAERYACSFGEALHAALPAALKREGGRRRTRMIRVAGPVAAEVFAEIARTKEKQHRLLRTQRMK